MPLVPTWAAPSGPPPVPPLPPQPASLPNPVPGSKRSVRAARILGVLVVAGLLFGGGYLTGRSTATSAKDTATPSTTSRPTSSRPATTPTTNGSSAGSDGEGSSGTTRPGSTSTTGRAGVTTTTAPSGSTPTTRSTTTPTTNGPALDRTKEPVEAVADVVRPAVVQLETNLGLGTGFVYDKSGLVLTAAHVISGARSVTVRLGNGSKIDGQVVGSDQNTDVAVVRFTPPKSGLATVALALDPADSPKVGQTAIAIGSPFGLDQTVTSGIVSAVSRPVPVGRNYVGMIQTDAPINSGNSGGPLVNLRGQVIGINDQIRTESGGNLGIGFAIPIDLAYDVAVALVAGRQPEFGFVGIQTDDPPSGEAGALITTITPDSPGDKAGLRIGDVITFADGKPITDFPVLQTIIRAHKPGDTLLLKVRREDGKEATIVVAVGKRAS